jgi:hypothetical protein
MLSRSDWDLFRIAGAKMRQIQPADEGQLAAQLLANVVYPHHGLLAQHHAAVERKADHA